MPDLLNSCLYQLVSPDLNEGINARWQIRIRVLVIQHGKALLSTLMAAKDTVYAFLISVKGKKKEQLSTTLFFLQ